MSPHFPSSLEEVPARNDGWDAQLLAPCPSIVGRVYVWRESWGKAARGDRNSLATGTDGALAGSGRAYIDGSLLAWVESVATASRAEGRASEPAV